MATVSTPYGLTAINLMGGQDFAGSTRLYSIASAYATVIQKGDPVLILGTGAGRGQINRFNATTAQGTVTAAVTAVGVFMGCKYTDPVTGPVWRQNYPGGIVAADIQAFVLDDPDALFQVQANGAVPQSALGCNFSLFQTNAPLTSLNAASQVGIQASSLATTATLPIRLVDFVNGPTSTINDAFTDCIVRINTHFHRQTTGTAAT